LEDGEDVVAADLALDKSGFTRTVSDVFDKPLLLFVPSFNTAVAPPSDLIAVVLTVGSAAVR